MFADFFFLIIIGDVILSWFCLYFLFVTVDINLFLVLLSLLCADSKVNRVERTRRPVTRALLQAEIQLIKIKVKFAFEHKNHTERSRAPLFSVLYNLTKETW